MSNYHFDEIDSPNQSRRCIQSDNIYSKSDYDDSYIINSFDQSVMGTSTDQSSLENCDTFTVTIDDPAIVAHSVSDDDRRDYVNKARSISKIIDERMRKKIEAV